MPSDENKPADGAQTPVQPAAPTESDSLETPAGGSAPAPSDAPPPKPGGWHNLPFIRNMWLMVFVLVVIAGAAVVFVSLKSSKSTTQVTKAGSLTDQQLASLKGNTTLVGDAKQTLDVQSNSIFEGEVLLRSNLDVAGSLKVGSGISIPSITVGGNGTFGQIGISGGLNVAGDTTLGGQLTVQKNLTVNGSASFGNLSVSQLGVTTLQLRGDLNINQHINASGGTPGRSLGTAVGSGGQASVSGSDTAGTVNISTGGSPPAGCFITVQFVHAFSSTPHVVISPSNSSAAGLDYYVSRTASSFSVCTASAPSASTTYTFDYIAIH
ncbi:MAG TPA: hypothetical protein VFJ84_02475 [Candidatus Saccharimonadales bacterium]|nr:hypothetical protein [Candidatus Saccharimonadales bacterium]